jgi:hypothetical protein
MTDEPPLDAGDYFRRQAAMVAGIAEIYGDSQRALRQLVEEHQDMINALGMRAETTELLTRMAANEQRVRLIGQVNAAQALAYEAMMTSGGPHDAEALNAYREATDWHNALLTTGDEDLPDR